MKKYYFPLLLTLICLNLVGQKRQVSSAELNQRIFDYITQYEFLAISESQRVGIPASIKLAQGILESRYGDSDLAVQANNHFGIKCKTDWTGEKVIADDDTPTDCFRKYNDVYESYSDHSDFLKNHRLHFYDHLFEIDVRDYRAWAKGLQLAGYATTNYYAQSLVLLIEKYELFLYDESEKGWTLSSNEIAQLSSKAQKIYSFETYPNTKNPPVVAKNQNVANSKKQIVVSTIPNKKSSDTEKVVHVAESKPMAQSVGVAPSRVHTFKEGETMESVSLQYEVDLEDLYEKNQMFYGAQPAIGTILYLDKTATQAPTLNVVKYEETEKPLHPIDYYGLINTQNPLLNEVLNQAFNQAIMDSLETQKLKTLKPQLSSGDLSSQESSIP